MKTQPMATPVRPGRVVVIGSLNMDLVVRTPRMPRPGETVAARSYATFPGGKGANQAVAAARMGADVVMVGRVGEDAFGESLIGVLRGEGIDTTRVWRTAGVSTGVASIWVDDGGANAIAIVAGANGELSPEDVRSAAEVLREASCVLVQLEVPLATVRAVLGAARAVGVPVILDPAPVHEEVGGWLGSVWAAVPNQVEAQALVGFEVATVEDGRRACRGLLERGVEVAVVKMAEQGVVAAWRGENRAYHIPAVDVQPVDTTAAGDAFSGALAAALASGMPLLEACLLANAAAGISTTRAGAQPSLPRRDEVQAFLRAHPGPSPRALPFG